MKRPLWKGHVVAFTLALLVISLGFAVGCEYSISGNPDVDIIESRVSPIDAVVSAGGNLELTASITGALNSNGLSWTISGDSSNHLTTSGNTAIYHAPAALVGGVPLTVTIIVQSTENPLRSSQCLVHVIEGPGIDSTQKINVLVDPLSVSLLTGNRQQFAVRMLGDNSGVTWSIVDGPGSISTEGLYAAPDNVSSDNNQVTIRAASITDPSRTAEATVSLYNVSDSIRCFSRDIAPILTANCGMSGCHGVGDGEPGLDVTSYASVMRTVRPGDARASQLYRSITELDRNQRMPPPPHPTLSAHDVRLIGQWIGEGALDCP